MLKEKIRNKSATVGVIGLGYVGLPLVLRFCEEGFPVIGFDVDVSKLELLHRGVSYLDHIADQSIAALQSCSFKATADFSQIALCDIIIICVPTPIDLYREPDLSYVLDTVESILPYIRVGQLVVLESTTYPGTTDEELLPRLESTGMVVGREIYLAYSPEREDPGNPDFTTRTIPKVVGGITANCLEMASLLYQQVIDQVIPVSSTRVAEMSKLLENIHRAVNIGLVNEMKMVADSMKIDINEVIDAAATKPFGFVPYRPGPGLGGHCIPIDPFYLTWKAKEYGVNTRFIELAGEINSQMPQWVVSKVADALNSVERSVKGSRILILGIAYKKNINDSRESPGIEIIDLLINRGAIVDYADPHIPQFPAKRDYKFKMESIPLTAATLAGYACVVLVTDHDRFDYPLIGAHAKLIVDSRGVFATAQANVVSA
jgi:UDP-N-acetyl-D-glucosamine dehydrogenase